MIEFVKSFAISIWQWFVNNKDAIVAFFISGQAVSFVAAIVMLIKNLKGTKANTASAKVLTESLNSNNEMKESVTKLGENFESLKLENDTLRNELKETEDKLLKVNNETINKLNSIIEVQSIVYSTIRDDNVRQTVNTILNNARYSEENFKESLEKQIEEFRNTYNSELQKVNELMTKSIDEVKNNLNAAKNAEKIMKKRSEDVTRY
jgi:septal ring factor EnvC (AmiA/AmiB activator)